MSDDDQSLAKDLKADISIMRTEVGSVNARLGVMENTLQRLTDVIVQIARIEVHQQSHTEAMERAFKEIAKVNERLLKHEEIADERFDKLSAKVPENLSTRLTVLEDAAPVGRLVSGWVLSWVAGVVGIVGGAVASKVLWP